MPNFKYKGVNNHGRVVEGIIEGDTRQSAEKSLIENGIDVVFIREKKGTQILSFLPAFTGVSNKEVVIFVRQFSVLISASITLAEALKILADQTDGIRLKSIIADIAANVEGGSRLSDSFEKYPKVFSGFFVNVIRSGETSGKLDDVLNYLADELEKDYDMNGKIKGAMIYPIIVFCILAVVGMGMMIFVVPKLTAMMDETGGELPLPTVILKAVSNFFVNFWYVVILIIVGIISLFRYIKQTPSGGEIIDHLFLKLPVFGNLMNKIYLVRFARSLHTLIVGGATITAGLKITADVVDNAIYRDLINKTIKEVEEGNSISSVFLANGEIIPRMVPQMMLVGEKTGRLDLVLEKIVDFYTREIDNVVANLMTLMEPIIMVVMGIGVFIMVAAIIMPMYSMSQSM